MQHRRAGSYKRCRRTSAWIRSELTIVIPSFCSESLHFVGLAISACLLTSSPCPSCTADSSAALRATAPVPSYMPWPCPAPLQPLLPLPFPAHLPCHCLCTSQIPSALTRGLSAFHLSSCPVGGTVGKASFCTLQRHFLLFTACHVLHPKTHQEQAWTTESTQYPSCIRLTSVHFG
jgi:hypothetical protein